MPIQKRDRPILWFTVAYIAVFGILALLNRNYEFLFYASIVIFVVLLLLQKYQKLGLSRGTLIALSVWGLLHMMGGNIPVDDGVLYGVQLIPVLLRYDQLVHAFGFGTCTMIGFELLRPFLRPTVNRATLSVLVVMIGMGFGALNEVIEFMAVLALPETGVGGYYNTAWDLTFNFIGSLVAVSLIRFRLTKTQSS